MSFPTDGSEDLCTKLVRTKHVLGELPFLLMIGQSMLWGEQIAHCNVFLHKARSTNLLFAIHLVL